VSRLPSAETSFSFGSIKISCIVVRAEPIVLQPIEPLSVRLGLYFEYLIPEGTFHDIQDGDTRNLTIGLFGPNGRVSSKPTTFMTGSDRSLSYHCS